MFARPPASGLLAVLTVVTLIHVAPTVGDLFEARAHTAGGFGFRYQLTEKYPMHIRLDFSRGRDGPLFYSRVSEAF